MDRRLFSHDPLTGITKWWHYDPESDTAVIQTTQNVADIVERNKSFFASTDERARWRELQRVASIPLSLYWELKAKGITEDQAAMRRWLNDPDNRFFRTRPGRV